MSAVVCKGILKNTLFSIVFENFGQYIIPGVMIGNSFYVATWLFKVKNMRQCSDDRSGRLVILWLM